MSYLKGKMSLEEYEKLKASKSYSKWSSRYWEKDNSPEYLQSKIPYSKKYLEGIQHGHGTIGEDYSKGPADYTVGSPVDYMDTKFNQEFYKGAEKEYNIASKVADTFVNDKKTFNKLYKQSQQYRANYPKLTGEKQGGVLGTISNVGLGIAEGLNDALKYINKTGKANMPTPKIRGQNKEIDPLKPMGDWIDKWVDKNIFKGAGLTEKERFNYLETGDSNKSSKVAEVSKEVTKVIGSIAEMIVVSKGAGVVTKSVMSSEKIAEALKNFPKLTKVVTRALNLGLTGTGLGTIQTMKDDKPTIGKLGKNVATNTAFMAGGELTASALSKGLTKYILKNPKTFSQIMKEITANGLGFGIGGYSAETGARKLMGENVSWNKEDAVASGLMGAAFAGIPAIGKAIKNRGSTPPPDLNIGGGEEAPPEFTTNEGPPPDNSGGGLKVKKLTNTKGELKKFSGKKGQMKVTETPIFNKEFKGEMDINEGMTGPKKGQLSVEEGQKANEEVKKLQSKFEKEVKQQVEWLKSTMNKGVEQGKVNKDAEGNIIGRSGRESKNEIWYQKYYKENGKKPNEKELDEIAKKQLINGYESNFGNIERSETVAKLEELGIKMREEKLSNELPWDKDAFDQNYVARPVEENIKASNKNISSKSGNDSVANTSETGMQEKAVVSKNKFETQTLNETNVSNEKIPKRKPVNQEKPPVSSPPVPSNKRTAPPSKKAQRIVKNLRGISKAEQTIKKSENTSEDLHKALREKVPTDYEVHVNKQDWQQSVDKVYKNPEKVLSDFMSKKSMKGNEVTDAMALIEHYEAKGDIESAVNITTELTIKLTESGQAIQAMSIWNRRSVEGLKAMGVKMQTKAYEKAGGEAIKQLEIEQMDLIKRHESIIKQAREKGCNW